MRITDLLRTIDLFEHLSPEELDQLSRRMVDRHLRPDEILCRQGEPVEAMFIIVGGSIELTTTGVDSRPALSQRLGPGDSFGEIALISSEPQPSTATGVGEARVLALDKDDF